MTGRLAWLMLLLCLGCIHASAQERRLVISAFPPNATDTLIIADSVELADACPAFDESAPIIYYAKADASGFAVLALNYETNESKTIYRGTGVPSAIRTHPAGNSLSCLVTDENQRSSLLRIPFQGGRTTMNQLPATGENFIWLDDNNIFFIKAGKPNTLALITLRPQRSMSIAQHVARSLARARGDGSFAFLHKLSVDSWSIKTVRPDGAITILAETPPGEEVFTLTAEGAPLLISENTLLVFDRDRKDWRELPESGINDSVRYIALNPAQNKIAFLVELEP